MTKVSIEYAHIYTNQNISEEHQTSVDTLGDMIGRFEVDGKETSLVVMVDDYSFPDPTFDYNSFVTWLDEQGFKPDLLVRESQLIPVCDKVLDILENGKLKRQIVDYVKAKKYPCSLFIAAWYLVRLGELTSSLFPEELVADEIFNILPESFKPFEDQGLKILESTPFKDCVKKIDYKFLEGRLIA